MEWVLEVIGSHSKSDKFQSLILYAQKSPELWKATWSLRFRGPKSTVISIHEPLMVKQLFMPPILFVFVLWRLPNRHDQWLLISKRVIPHCNIDDINSDGYHLMVFAWPTAIFYGCSNTAVIHPHVLSTPYEPFLKLQSLWLIISHYPPSLTIMNHSIAAIRYSILTV